MYWSVATWNVTFLLPVVPTDGATVGAAVAVGAGTTTAAALLVVAVVVPLDELDVVAAGCDVAVTLLGPPQALRSVTAPSARLPRMSTRREIPCVGTNSGYCVLCMDFSFHITLEDTSPNREQGFL